MHIKSVKLLQQGNGILEPLPEVDIKLSGDRYKEAVQRIEEEGCPDCNPAARLICPRCEAAADDELRWNLEQPQHNWGMGETAAATSRPRRRPTPDPPAYNV